MTDVGFRNIASRNSYYSLMMLIYLTLNSLMKELSAVSFRHMQSSNTHTHTLSTLENTDTQLLRMKIESVD